jgi:hypothetical protein
MGSGIESQPGWQESVYDLSWRVSTNSRFLRGTGRSLNCDTLARVGDLGYKLSRVGLRTLGDARTLGMMLAGMDVHISELPQSLPSLAHVTSQALTGLTYMGAEMENAVQYLKSKSSDDHYCMGAYPVLEADRVVENAASAVSNLRAGTATLRDLTKLAWVGEAVRRFADFDMRSYVAKPGLLEIHLISPACRLAKKAFGSSVTDAPTR